MPIANPERSKKAHELLSGHYDAGTPALSAVFRVPTSQRFAFKLTPVLSTIKSLRTSLQNWSAFETLLIMHYSTFPPSFDAFQKYSAAFQALCTKMRLRAVILKQLRPFWNFILSRQINEKKPSSSRRKSRTMCRLRVQQWFRTAIFLIFRSGLTRENAKIAPRLLSVTGGTWNVYLVTVFDSAFQL